MDDKGTKDPDTFLCPGMSKSLGTGVSHIQIYSPFLPTACVQPLGAPLIPEGAGSSPHRRDDKDFRDYVASVLQSVSVPGQGARINYRAGLLKPDRSRKNCQEGLGGAECA